MSVHCTVDNCQWWQNNKYMTEGILITSENIGAQLPDGPDYPEYQKHCPATRHNAGQQLHEKLL